MPQATAGAFDWAAGCVIRHGCRRMENGPFDSCGPIRFPCSFYFKSLPARQRVRIAQPRMTASVITPATKPSIKRSKSEAGFPARWSASGRNGGVGFSLNSRRACLLQTLRAIFVASWDDRSVRPQDSAPHTRRGCGRGFSVNYRLICANQEELRRTEF